MSHLHDECVVGEGHVSVVHPAGEEVLPAEVQAVAAEDLLQNRPGARSECREGTRVIYSGLSAKWKRSC